MTTDKKGVARTADTRVSKEDYAGTYRIEKDNWRNFTFWANLGSSSYDVDSFDSFRLEWQGDDLKIMGLRGSRVVSRSLQRSGEDFSWRGGKLRYPQSKADKMVYYPGAFGRISGGDVAFLDHDRNFVTLSKSRSTGLFLFAVPNLHLMSDSHLYSRLPASR